MRPVSTAQFRLAMPSSAPTPEEIAAALRAPDRRAALARVVTDSGVDQERIATRIGMSPGQLSRIVSARGDKPMHLPVEAYHAIQHAAGNWALLLWDVHHAGFDPSSLRPLESELQRENRLLREQLAQAHHDRDAVEAAMRRMLTGQGIAA